MRIIILTSDSSSSGGLTERWDDVVEGDDVVSREQTVEEDFKVLQATLSCPNMNCLQSLHLGLNFPEGVRGDTGT